MDEKMLSLEQEIKIKEKALKLKEEKKLRKICPMVVFGDTRCICNQLGYVFSNEHTSFDKEAHISI